MQVWALRCVEDDAKVRGDVRAADRPPLGRAVSREMEFGKSASDGEAAARAPRRCGRGGFFAGVLQLFTVFSVATLVVGVAFLNSVDRAHLDALRRVEVAHALGSA